MSCLIDAGYLAFYFSDNIGKVYFTSCTKSLNFVA